MDSRYFDTAIFILIKVWFHTYKNQNILMKIILLSINIYEEIIVKNVQKQY